MARHGRDLHRGERDRLHVVWTNHSGTPREAHATTHGTSSCCLDLYSFIDGSASTRTVHRDNYVLAGAAKKPGAFSRVSPPIRRVAVLPVRPPSLRRWKQSGFTALTILTRTTV